MSALILDFATLREFYPIVQEARLEKRFHARRIVDMAAEAYRERERKFDIARKRSEAGKKGAAAIKGRPRRCRYCREVGHYGNACPSEGRGEWRAGEP